jgi:hypothetical protein
MTDDEIGVLQLVADRANATVLAGSPKAERTLDRLMVDGLIECFVLDSYPAHKTYSITDQGKAELERRNG